MERDLARYRPCVGAVIFDAQGRVWLGERADAAPPHNWQFPQGGIDPGEDAETALWRELAEEIGAGRAAFELLARHPNELIYDYPPEVAARKNKAGKRHLGQRQTWFALRHRGGEFQFDAEDPPEFSDWMWADFATALERVVPFKRAVYAELAQSFADWTHG